MLLEENFNASTAVLQNVVVLGCTEAWDFAGGESSRAAQLVIAVLGGRRIGQAD